MSGRAERKKRKISVCVWGGGGEGGGEKKKRRKKKEKKRGREEYDIILCRRSQEI